VAIDDLLQDGFIGLMDAVLRNTKHKAGQSLPGAIISQRVRGAMLDGLRQNDPWKPVGAPGHAARRTGDP
jgi:RNA polymerase sigma factor for flagellar operon FliA